MQTKWIPRVYTKNITKIDSLHNEKKKTRKQSRDQKFVLKTLQKMSVYITSNMNTCKQSGDQEFILKSLQK